MTRSTRETRQLKIVIVGHVDHGKSTLVGRLIYDTGSLPDGKLEAIKAMSERRGMPFEWAFLMDAIQAERDQGITIDTTQIWFRTEKRPYVIIDAPGHKEFLKNMVTGAASSEAALLLIDAHEGVQEQSRRHGYLLHLLGVRAGRRCWSTRWTWSATRPTGSARSPRNTAPICAAWASTPACIIPISAREGDNMVEHSAAHALVPGPDRAAGAGRLRTTRELPTERPLRMPVQDVYKFDQRRIIAGRIESGTLEVGDEVVFSPSNKTARDQDRSRPGTCRRRRRRPQAGQCDRRHPRRADLRRARRGDEPPRAARRSRATCSRRGCSGSATSRCRSARATRSKLGTLEAPVTVEAIERVIDTSDLSTRPCRADRAQRCRRGRAAHQAHAGARRASAEPDHRPLRPGRGLPAGGRRHHLDGGLSRPAPADHRALDQHHRGRPRRHPRGPLGAQRPQGRRALVHRPVGRRQVDPGAGARARAVRQGLPGLRAGRRQYPRRPQRQSRLQPGGPGREHPPRRRGGRRCSPMPASSSSARSSRPTAPTASGRGPRPRTRSTRSTSRPRSTPARTATPRASTSARARARSRTSPGSAAPTSAGRTPTSWCRPTSCRSRTAWSC